MVGARAPFILFLPLAFAFNLFVKVYEWFHFSVSNTIVTKLRRFDRAERPWLKKLYKWVYN